MAKLNDPSVVCPWFTADKSGDYVIRLIVTDSQSDPSDPDELLVSTWNAPPVAEAGPDQAVLLTGSTVTLDGSQSYDANEDSIMYQWTLVSKPVGSNAPLSPVLPRSGPPLFRRNASTLSPPAFTSIAMLDDGNSDDGLAGDGIFAAVLPARTNGSQQSAT